MKGFKKPLSIQEHNKIELQKTLDAYLRYKLDKMTAEQFWNFMAEMNFPPNYKIKIRIRESMLYYKAKVNMYAKLDQHQLSLQKDYNLFNLMLDESKDSVKARNILQALPFENLVYITIIQLNKQIIDRFNEKKAPPTQFERQIIAQVVKTQSHKDLLNGKYKDRDLEQKWAKSAQEIADKFPAPAPINYVDTFIDNISSKPINTNQPRLSSKPIINSDTINTRIALFLFGMVIGIGAAYSMSKLLISTKPIPMILYPLQSHLPERSMRAAENIIMRQIDNYTGIQL